MVVAPGCGAVGRILDDPCTILQNFEVRAEPGGAAAIVELASALGRADAEPVGFPAATGRGDAPTAVVQDRFVVTVWGVSTAPLCRASTFDCHPPVQ
jgi:hypothetical protein